MEQIRALTEVELATDADARYWEARCKSAEAMLKVMTMRTETAEMAANATFRKTETGLANRMQRLLDEWRESKT